MKITSGSCRGRPIKAPPGQAVRPTADKVRQAVFNVLYGYELPNGAAVADLCCGTGALGLEALSRGAASCLFVDDSETHLRYARGNAEAFGLSSAATFIRVDATRLKPRIPAQSLLNLIFIDPPYRQSLIVPVLQSLVTGEWLAPGALCVCESEKGLALTLPAGFMSLTHKNYGDTAVSFLRYSAPV